MRQKRRVVGLVAYALVTVMAACSSSSSDGGGTTPPGTPPAAPTATTPPATGTAGKGTVGASGGNVATADGVLTVTIPAGALPADTTITIDEIASPAAGAVGKTYEIGPTGTTFAVPVTLAFGYGSFDLQGADPTTLEAATIANGQWVALASGAVDTSSHVVTGQTLHLSPYGIHAKAKQSVQDAASDAANDAAGDAADDASDAADEDATASDGATSSDGAPTDAAGDGNGCTPGASQVGSCLNHPLLCSGTDVFTNCVTQAVGYTYDCCPGG